MSGVSCVLLVSSFDGKSGPQGLEGLMKKTELLGATRLGRMHVESAIYFSNNPKSHCKNFQVLTNTEYPASCFVFTDNGTALVADLAFREFAGYLKASYQRKKKLQVEGKGIKYKLGDFGINFITLFMGQSATVKGYLIEVIFQASCTIHLCGDILRSFITQVLPDVCPSANEPNSAENIFSQSFHRAVQTGTFESPRWPLSQIYSPTGLTASAEPPALAHACVRLAMNQFAEHINTVRRLSKQSASSTPVVTGSVVSGGQFVQNSPQTTSSNTSPLPWAMDKLLAELYDSSSVSGSTIVGGHHHDVIVVQGVSTADLTSRGLAPNNVEKANGKVTGHSKYDENNNNSNNHNNSNIKVLTKLQDHVASECLFMSDQLLHELRTRDKLLDRLQKKYDQITAILDAAFCISEDQDTRLKFSTEPSAGDEAFKEWREAMRRMAHLGDGLPRFVRRRVWSTLADHHLAKQHVDWDHVVSLAFNEKSNPDDHRLGSQIVKDLHRTGCEQFGSDEDRAALKRVLLAYARWNKRVGYCQGFNVIAAAILDAIERDEKVAFKIMVYLIDYVLPESYFAQNLQALSVDIAVFRQLLQSKLPDLAKHLDYLQYKADMDCYATLGERTPNTTSTKNRLSTFEPPLMNVYIIQWFLTLFATCLAPDAVMRIWDSILLEGSEVILRTAVVIMDFLASRLMRLKSADEFYSTMNELMAEFAEGRIVSTQELLYEIYQLGPFPSTTVKELRERFMYNVAPLVSDSVSEKADLVQKASNGESTRRKLFSRLIFGRQKSDVKHITETAPNRANIGVNKQGKMSDDMKGCKGKFKNTEERNEENAPDANKKDAISEECSYHEVSLDCSMENLEQKLNCPNEQNHSAQAGTLRSRPKSLALKSNEEDTEEISANCMSMSWLQKTLSAPVVSNKPTISKTPPSSADYLSSLSRPVSRKSNQVNRRHSLSPKNSYTPKDISEVGPGAVGEECGPRPRSQPPSAHQARINTSLNELKSLYQKQIARQRGTTLKLPGLWDVDEPDPVSGILSQYASVTAVLPQNKETRQMDLVSSTNTLASTGGAEHSRSSRLSQSTECDEVFMESDISSKTPAGDPNERTGFLDASTPRGGSSDIDPDLLGAVKSWQEKAVWSSKPSIADNDVVCPSVVHPVHSKPLDRNSPKNPVTQATKKSKPCSLQPDSRHPTLLELASRASNLSSDPDVTLNANGNDSVSVVSTTYMSMRSETYSETLVSCASSFDDSPEGVYTRRASEPISNELLSRANGKNNNMKPDVVCSTQKNQYMQEGAAPCPELTDGDTESFCTTISHGTVTTSCTKKAPWEEAIASFLARKSLNGRNSQVPVTSHLPLSPTRQKFGAKFGMYKNISYPKNQRMPNFCDRVQMLELTRSALTQQELNCR